MAAALLVIIVSLLPLRRRWNAKQSEIDLQIQNLEEQRNLLEAGIRDEQKAIESFEEKIVNYARLKGLTEHLGMCLSLEDTSRTLAEEVNRLFGSHERTVILYLFHSRTGDLGISASHKGEMRVNLKAKQGDLFDQWVVKGMQPLLIEDTKNDYRFDMDKMTSEDLRPLRSLISVPLMVGHKAMGILRIDSPCEGDFTTQDLRFLTTIGDVGAVAIENAHLCERLEQLAIQDSLTGLYLRRYLTERMPEEIGRQLRNKGRLSFLMMDLDHFKQYNDRFGHTAGDIVLRAVGTLLADCFRQPGVLLCRYGGEEFSALLPDCSKAEALELAEGIRTRIAGQTIVLRREETRMTVSIGVASCPEDAVNPRELVHKADMALYAAKAGGRNRVCPAA